MKKEMYETPVSEVVLFESEDVITASVLGANELDILADPTLGM